MSPSPRIAVVTAAEQNMVTLRRLLLARIIGTNPDDPPLILLA
jgi:hypothetical protein